MTQPQPACGALRALLTSLSIAALAAGVTLTSSGCISMIAGLGCAAAGGNGCSSETFASAARADAQIAGVMIEGAVRQAHQDERAADAAPAEVPPPPIVEPVQVIVPPSPALVDITVTGVVPERVSVYEPRLGVDTDGDGSPERTSALVGTCPPPCTLSLPPADYLFSVGGYSMRARVTIPEVPHRSVHLQVDSHEELRLWGWGFVGLSLAGMAGGTVAMAEADITEIEVVLPTMLGLSLLLITGVVLGLIPDEVTPTLVF